MDYLTAIKSAINIIKLDAKATINVSKDGSAFGWGLLFVLISGLLAELANKYGSSQTSTYQQGFVFLTAIISSYVIVFFVWIIAKLFRGKATFLEHWKAQAFASVLGWLVILDLIPKLGQFILVFSNLWSIPVSVMIIKNVHRLTIGRAIFVVIIPALLILILLILIGILAYAGLISPQTISNIIPGGTFVPA